MKIFKKKFAPFVKPINILLIFVSYLNPDENI